MAEGGSQPNCVKTPIDDVKSQVKATDEDSRRALLAAAVAGSAETVKALLQHPDCRVNAIKEDGRTALHLSADAKGNSTMTIFQ